MTVSPHTIGADQPLRAAQALMRENHIRHLPVLDGGRLVGVISQRDAYLLESIAGAGATEAIVSEAMTEEPFAVAPDASVESVVREMAREKIGCAVVADGGVIVGMFTTTDALKVLAELLAERHTGAGAGTAPPRRRAARR